MDTKIIEAALDWKKRAKELEAENARLQERNDEKELQLELYRKDVREQREHIAALEAVLWKILMDAKPEYNFSNVLHGWTAYIPNTVYIEWMEELPDDPPQDFNGAGVA